MTWNILSNCAQYVISMSYIIISFNENKCSNKKYQTFIDTFGVVITSYIYIWKPDISYIYKLKNWYCIMLTLFDITRLVSNICRWSLPLMYSEYRLDVLDAAFYHIAHQETINMALNHICSTISKQYYNGK